MTTAVHANRRHTMRVLRVIVVLVLFAFATPASAATTTPAVDLESYVVKFVSQLPGRGSEALKLPTSQQVTAFFGVIGAARSGDVATAQRLAKPLNCVVETMTDTRDGRPLIVVREKSFSKDVYRGWGLYVITAPPTGRMIVEAAHPVFDVNTPQMAVEAFRDGRAAALMVAGTHRYANADGTSDVAHEPRTMFAKVNTYLVGPGSMVLQPHGFDGTNYSYGDIVVSKGAAPPSPMVNAVAGALKGAGYATCVYDGTQCSGLGGTTNVEGQWARSVGADFVHLETARWIRDDATKRAQVARLTAGAMVSTATI